MWLLGNGLNPHDCFEYDIVLVATKELNKILKFKKGVASDQSLL